MWGAFFGARVALVGMVNQGQVLVFIHPVLDNCLAAIHRVQLNQEGEEPDRLNKDKELPPALTGNDPCRDMPMVRLSQALRCPARAKRANGL
jgi:hypothetical protein